jgi:hypothetical protein
MKGRKNNFIFMGMDLKEFSGSHSHALDFGCLCSTEEQVAAI